IHDTLRRLCPRCMWASSTHALGTLPPPSSIVFLAIPTLYMKDDNRAQLASRAGYAFCSQRPPPAHSRPPLTYSPAFAGRWARRWQDRAGQLCFHSSRSLTPDRGTMCATTMTQRCAAASRVCAVHRAQVRSRARPGTQPQSLQNRQGEARGVGSPKFSPTHSRALDPHAARSDTPAHSW
ncbi:hypothetical protein DFH09DRAFT_1203347, partial [Mycena vulgaris]